MQGLAMILNQTRFNVQAADSSWQSLEIFHMIQWVSIAPEDLTVHTYPSIKMIKAQGAKNKREWVRTWCNIILYCNRYARDNGFSGELWDLFWRNIVYMLQFSNPCNDQWSYCHYWSLICCKSFWNQIVGGGAIVQCSVIGK